MEKTLLQQIDELIDKVNNDTTRGFLPELCIKLIKLSQEYWDAKSFVVRTKSMIDMMLVELKDKLRKEFEAEQDELEKINCEDKKRKRAKITIDELEIKARQDEELKNLLLARRANEETMVRYEPLIKAYYEFITNIRFIDNQSKTLVPNM